MQEKELTKFELNEIYENEIEPLVKKIDIICKANKLPYFFAACVKNDEEGSDYVYDGNLCGSNGFVLKDDKITDFLRLLVGFKIKSQEEKTGAYTITPPGNDINLDFSDV